MAEWFKRSAVNTFYRGSNPLGIFILVKNKQILNYPRYANQRKGKGVVAEAGGESVVSLIFKCGFFYKQTNMLKW
jgi:hypothetical protein